MHHRTIEQDDQRYMTPIRQRPRNLQVAALCLRGAPGQREVMMVTSRGTGRWILPKGWPMVGKTLADTAAQEAWEEAGVRGVPVLTPVGSYQAVKVLDDGRDLPCRVEVFEVAVTGLSDSYPEVGQRRRQWMLPSRAAGLVLEPGLKALLADL